MRRLLLRVKVVSFASSQMSVAVPLHEIRAEFAELDDPVDRTTYLIEVGRTLPPLDEHLKTEENRVLGCQARVWLIPQERPVRRGNWNSSPIATPKSFED